MDNAELFEKIKKGIRALLISAPRGVPTRLFLVDYRKVMGQELPFRALGFRDVREFIHGLPDVIREAPGPTGEPTLFPVVTAETSQIARFVATQKKPKIKKSLMPPSTTTPSRKGGMKTAGFSNNYRQRRGPPSRPGARTSNKKPKNTQSELIIITLIKAPLPLVVQLT